MYETESKRAFDKESVSVLEKQRQQERDRNSKPDRVNEFTLIAHILNSLATCGALGTMVTMQCHASLLLKITTVACYKVRH